MSNKNKSSAWTWLVAGLLSLGLLVCVFSVDYVPTHDGPNHIASCVLDGRIDDSTSGVGDYLVHGAPVTTLGFHALCTQFLRALDWQGAYRGVVLVVVFVWSFGFLYLARGLGGVRAVQFLGFGSAFCWNFYMGFFNFLLAAGCALWILGYVVRFEKLSVKQSLALSFVLLSLVMVHAVVTAFLGILIFFVQVIRAPHIRAKVRSALGVSVLGIPAGVLALQTASGKIDEGDRVLHSFSEKIQDLVENFVGGGFFRAESFLLFALGGLVFGAWGAFKRRSTGPQRGIFLFASLCLLVFFLVPHHIPNWAYMGPRFSFFPLLLFPLTVPECIFRRPIWKNILFVLSISLSILLLELVLCPSPGVGAVLRRSFCGF